MVIKERVTLPSLVAPPPMAVQESNSPVVTMGERSLTVTTVTTQGTDSPVSTDRKSPVSDLMSAQSSSSDLSAERITSSSNEDESKLTKSSFLPLVADFKKAIGSAHVMHGAKYRSLIHALEDYKRNEAFFNQDPVTKEKQLKKLWESASLYLSEKEKRLTEHNRLGKDAPSKQNDPSWQKELTRLQGARRTASSLISDIPSELSGRKLIIDFDQRKEKTSQDHFASGAMASVSKVTYTDDQVAVFKPVSFAMPVKSMVAKEAGIPEKSTMEANLHGRAVATSCVCEMLGWGNLVPTTGFATHHHQLGSCQIFAEGESLYKEKWDPVSTNELLNNKKSGAVQFLVSYLNEQNDDSIVETEREKYQITCNPPLVKGEKFYIYEKGQAITLQRASELVQKGLITVSRKVVETISDVNFSDPQLQRELSKAYLLDFVTGQLDRNAGNFIYYKTADGKWNVALIDNDLCLSAKGKSLPLPDLMDKEAAEALLALTPEALREVLQEDGLTKEEITASCDRLKLLQEHIVQAGKNQPPNVPRLITKWNQEIFNELNTRPSPENNYVGKQSEIREVKKEERPSQLKLKLLDEIKTHRSPL